MIEITKTLKDGSQVVIKAETGHVWAVKDGKIIASDARLTKAPAAYPGCSLIAGKLIVTADEAAQITTAIEIPATPKAAAIWEGTGQDVQAVIESRKTATGSGDYCLPTDAEMERLNNII